MKFAQGELDLVVEATGDSDSASIVPATPKRRADRWQRQEGMRAPADHEKIAHKAVVELESITRGAGDALPLHQQGYRRSKLYHNADRKRERLPLWPLH